ncbi:MAG: hypothetical protein HJHJAOHD_02700 [Flavobacteriales bacterium]|nr:hypothetical protein [Flavobacteriales bacterium]
MKAINKDIELYSRQFENTNKLIGQTIREVDFYLEKNDTDFTEQPNEFGKSLLNGIDIKTDLETYSIGNRYTDSGYGLSIDFGETNSLEYFDDEKKPVSFTTEIVGGKIKSVEIYWMNIPFEEATGLYPQEIEIQTDNGFFLISSIEVNNGQVNTVFTNELLIIDNKETAKQLGLGRFGLADKDRKKYNDLNELIENEIKNGL